MINDILRVPILKILFHKSSMKLIKGRRREKIEVRESPKT